jgi:hypothetical protein
MKEEQRAQIWENILRIKKNKVHMEYSSQIKILDYEEHKLKKILFKTDPPKKRH